MSIRVFVYGTLKKGKGNHRLLTEATFLGRAKIKGPYLLVSLGGFPGVIKTQDGVEREVSGEVYQINDDILQSLDWLEGHPRFYERHKVRTPFKSAWCYFLPESYARYPHCDVSWQPEREETEWLLAEELSRVADSKSA